MRTLVTLLLSLLCTLPSAAQNLTPSPNSTTSQARPTISATFDRDIGWARIWVDGIEFTNSADHRNRTIRLIPPYNLDYGIHRVQVRTAYGRTVNWNFEIARRGQGGNWNQGGGWNQGVHTEVLRYGPEPGSVVTVTRPPIQAIFSGQVRNVRLTVDGVDVTGAARVQNNRVTWNPGYDLDQGQHNCIVTGNTSNGQAVRGEWNFQIRSW